VTEQRPKRERPPLDDLAGRLALRPAEAARVLGVSERTLRTLLPRLPHVRLDRCVLLPVDALRRWLDEQAKARAVEAERDAAAILAALRAPSKQS